jgi:hypothetical protein
MGFHLLIFCTLLFSVMRSTDIEIFANCSWVDSRWQYNN